MLYNFIYWGKTDQGVYSKNRVNNDRNDFYHIHTNLLSCEQGNPKVENSKSYSKLYSKLLNFPKTTFPPKFCGTVQFENSSTQLYL